MVQLYFPLSIHWIGGWLAFGVESVVSLEPEVEDGVLGVRGEEGDGDGNFKAVNNVEKLFSSSLTRQESKLEHLF
jgi:hypothetical protein